MTDRILGLDPGTYCGWAVMASDGTVLGCGVWDCSVRSGEGGGMRYVRFLRLFEEVFMTFEPSIVGYEKVKSHKGTAAAHVYGGIVAHITRVCESADVPYVGIDVGTIKKLATGKGNASKEAMVEAAAVRWPAEAARLQTAKTINDDLADGLWTCEATRREAKFTPGSGR